MTTFIPPLTDLRFNFEHIIGYEEIGSLQEFKEVGSDVVDAILNESGKFASEELAPLNRTGDTQGCTLENGVVRTPSGFKESYKLLCEAGWLGISSDPEFGGQGLPTVLSIAAQEIWSAANMAFGLVPLLSQSATELMLNHATPDQKNTYLPKIVSGEWATTMNLTEPQAGSDLNLLKTKATKEDDHYKIVGQKIYITGGDHDLTDNIIHFVLARLPDAPPGTRGISLFIVPKFIVKRDGTPGKMNDLRCVSLEHKLGLHGSPTCVMSYGDDNGALGYLIGEENQGLACMFTMMNLARIAVGVQGVGIAERAYQQALAYARERVQGNRKNDSGKLSPVNIIQHPDVKRMLLDMKSITEASRTLALYTGYCLDASKKHQDPDVRQGFADRVALLTPLVKAWITDRAIEITNIGIQVHGGMGYIEETGAAQHFRDARITSIYEGTNGIQASDLVRRKIIREQGQSITNLIGEMRADLEHDEYNSNNNLSTLSNTARLAISSLESSTHWLIETWPEDPDFVEAGATTFMRISGNAICGWLMARVALKACKLLEIGNEDLDFVRGKILSAQHFIETQLLQNSALEKILTSGNSAVAEIKENEFR